MTSYAWTLQVWRAMGNGMVSKVETYPFRSYELAKRAFNDCRLSDLEGAILENKDGSKRLVKGYIFAESENFS